jgi:hypothetical protein
MGYDIIGDIHGSYWQLVGLLTKMGYSEVDGVWGHPNRMAIFAGDLVDRKRQQLMVIRLVQRMINAGKALAIMGNHEFNAIAWFMQDPENQGEFLRRHTAKNREQHSAFLAEVEHDPVLHEEIINWFLDLPLWLDLPGFRVVHACWHPTHMDALGQDLRPGNRLTRDLVEKASRKGSKHFDAVETITKGLEVPLPKGMLYLDKEGHERTNVRVRWWDQSARTLKLAAIVSKSEMTDLPDVAVGMDATPGYHGEKPLFVGHYWRNGEPSILNTKMACVDYSAGKDGALVAYRWDGEDVLSDSKFSYF